MPNARAPVGPAPRGGTRGSPIKAVVLTGAEIDQVTGLLSLREREPFTLCATAATLGLIEENSMFAALSVYYAWGVIPLNGCRPDIYLALLAHLGLMPGA